MGNDRLSISAPAKVNLFLRITGRRPDGYHTLETLMQKVDLFDHLELKRCAFGIHLQCPDSDLPEDEGNLAYRAAGLFLDLVGDRITGQERGIRMTLSKEIPQAAGLGGGSSDAAAVLTGMNSLFAADCSTEELACMGLKLGADVPFFIYDWPVSWATGIGDRLTPAASMQDVVLLLVNPGFSVSTKWAYETFALTSGENIFNLIDSPRVTGNSVVENPFAGRTIRPEEMINDLEEVTAARYQEIKQLKACLLDAGAEVAMMSGSGPTVFGLFEQRKYSKAQACLRYLQKIYTQTFIVRPLATDC
ncbi:MAG: 4-(cytidine 5'-diphospho)-2-C-methyl-D-erythritol kinase [Desulfobulbaceae bacterium]|nr:4-(cytidine 5'-diphospho)-2-C-methyl-D-erythritol kinase [Desulfobulbaceae bacterium]